MQLLKDIFHLFYPFLCVNCSVQLLKEEQFLCTNCVHDLPIITYNEVTQKMLQAVFYGRIPISQVFSFLYYTKHGITQKLIHDLKYKNQQEIGVFLGRWMAHELREISLFNEVDYIIPVPLHPLKEKQRGYNQVTKFAKTLGKELGIPYQPDLLIRTSTSTTQTLKQRFERFSNNNTKFQLTCTSFFVNKHVLLVDDVITTGATLEACCNELLKTENIIISICTIAYTEKV